MSNHERIDRHIALRSIECGSDRWCFWPVSQNGVWVIASVRERHSRIRILRPSIYCTESMRSCEEMCWKYNKERGLTLDEMRAIVDSSMIIDMPVADSV